MNDPERSAFRRSAIHIALTGLLFSLSLLSAACRSNQTARGTSVTLTNGETAGVIVTMNPNESATQGAPSESVSGTATTGDDVIAAPTSPKTGESFAYRYQNIVIRPGADAAEAVASITEDCKITDAVETDKKGTEITVKSYAFANFVLYARQNAEGKYIITRIILSGKDSVTPEGIGFGAGSEDVIKTYGSQYTDNGNSITYTSGTTDLTFFFANGTVTDITYSYNKLP